MFKINRPTCPDSQSLSNGNYKHPTNKAALIAASHDKCMYCESKISHVYYGDVEHILPKTDFPHLEFEWSNLGYVCAKCNGIKKAKYNSTTSFINPYDEDPNDHLVAVGAIVKHKKGSERGQITIDEKLGIGLNRSQLLERRMERIASIEKAIDSCFRTSNVKLREIALEELKMECNDDKEYSIYIKGILKSHEII